MLTAYFYHKTTGAPLTDALVTVRVTLANMNNDSLILDNQSMTPSTSFPGAFRHTYQIDREIDYMVYYSCSDSNYIAQVDKLYIPATGGGGGGFSINYGAINSNFTKKVNELRDEILLIPKKIEQGFNDTKSQIEIAKGEITDKIDAIEIPEVKLEEKEAKKVLKIVTDTSKTLKSYIDSEMKEKDEVGAITKELIKLDLEDEMTKAEKKKKEEEEKRMEEEEQKAEDARIAELLNKEFDKLEEEDKKEKKKELEKELEETLKEAEEIKQELKSL